RLTAAQVDLLRRWIAQGASYAEHWAFVAPRRPALPATSRPGWARNAIDHFILARLDGAGMRPAPEEVDAFLADRRPDAYEHLVERLLASAHYGERMAVDWLDVARFADTHGYHIDAGRDMSRWREWVIDAFN